MHTSFYAAFALYPPSAAHFGCRPFYPLHTTLFFNVFLCSALSTSSAAIYCNSGTLLSLYHAVCEVSSTCLQFRKGCVSGKGSVSNTSNPAIICCFSNAAASATVSTKPPLEVLTRIVPLFMLPMVVSLIRWRVASLRGRCSE